MRTGGRRVPRRNISCLFADDGTNQFCLLRVVFLPLLEKKCVILFVALWLLRDDDVDPEECTRGRKDGGCRVSPQRASHALLVTSAFLAECIE